MILYINGSRKKLRNSLSRLKFQNKILIIIQNLPGSFFIFNKAPSLIYAATY